MKFKDQINRDLSDVKNDLEVLRKLIGKSSISGEDAMIRINQILNILARAQEKINMN